MLRICPGYRIADGGEPVARARRVERRPREQSAEWLNVPEAMLRICPGYRSADGDEPVARTAQRYRENKAQSVAARTCSRATALRSRFSPPRLAPLCGFSHPAAVG
ncbi:hypothetical protein EGY08_07835 [Klebsiella sp. FDAARGOS_511]|nr:hypothetical protein EGY08_07835 [Klebsiella sp. FDAARGOS_511]MBF8463795.1 hypothetical protein [Klebsiella michiganensis]MBZ7661390.1 hypothetical protein [Klebsiella grimontii]